jgi:uncharacterized protein Veg
VNRLAIQGGRAPLLSDRGEVGEVYSEHFVILIDGQVSHRSLAQYDYHQYFFECAMTFSKRLIPELS